MEINPSKVVYGKLQWIDIHGRGKVVQARMAKEAAGKPESPLMSFT